MEKKLFAIKIPEVEKKAMDFTSAATGLTLTNLYYQGVRNTLHEILGAVLLQHLDPRVELVKPMLSTGIAMRHVPTIVEEFVELMDGGEKEEFKKMFYNVKSVEKEDIFQEFSIYDLTRYMGRKYLEAGGSFPDVDIGLIETLFFDYMLYLYYRVSVVGSMRVLEQEWERNYINISNLRTRLVDMYRKKYGSLVAPVKVEYENVKKGK